MQGFVQSLEIAHGSFVGFECSLSLLHQSYSYTSDFHRRSTLQIGSCRGQEPVAIAYLSITYLLLWLPVLATLALTCSVHSSQVLFPQAFQRWKCSYQAHHNNDLIMIHTIFPQVRVSTCYTPKAHVSINISTPSPTQRRSPSMRAFCELVFLLSLVSSTPLAPPLQHTKVSRSHDQAHGLLPAAYESATRDLLSARIEPAQAVRICQTSPEGRGYKWLTYSVLNNDVYIQLNNDFTPVPFARSQHPLM